MTVAVIPVAGWSLHGVPGCRARPEPGTRLRGGRAVAEPQAAEHAGGDDQRRRDAEAGVAPAAPATPGRRQVEHGAEQLLGRRSSLAGGGTASSARDRG